MLMRSETSDKILKAYVDFKNEKIGKGMAPYKPSQADVDASVVASMYSTDTLRAATVLSATFERQSQKKK